MKKTIALLLALAMVMTAVSVLAATGSKGGNNYNQGTTSNNGFFFKVTDDEEMMKWAREELEKLKAAESIPAYFDQADELNALLGEGEYKVFEFNPVVAGNYDDSMGEITGKFAFATPYEEGADVAALLGFAATDENGEDTVDWTTMEAAAKKDGSIEFKVDPDTIKQVQESGALLAIVSK